jgi:hypothetical protein
VAGATGLTAFWLTWFSRPAGDRLLFRAIRNNRPRKMMVLGLGDATRALRMISLAQRYNPPDQISFAGIDRFDSRPVEASPFSLKDAHRLLRPTGSRINLIPGDPREALVRAATVLHGIDLLVVSADQDAQSLAQGWFFVPRMLAPQAMVLREEATEKGRSLKPLSPFDLERLSAAAAPRRRAA